MDFVNIDLTKDNKLFIDPLRIRNGKTDFHKNCFAKIERFVEIMINLSQERKFKELIEFIENFYERNETRLGYSIDTMYGKSFGENGGTDLVKQFTKNNIWESGFVEDIFDFMMVIPNIAEDKVSDLITTILFLDLIEYTQNQCEKWKIPTKKVTLDKLCWNSDSETWEKRKKELPVYRDRAFVLVPKSFVGKDYIFSHEKLYRDVIIPMYKELELKNKESKFVVRYKNGRVHVLGNKLREEYPCTKYVILDFIKQYDLVYREYKNKILENIKEK